MKTYSAKAADIEKKWVTIDAAGLDPQRYAVYADPPRGDTSWQADGGGIANSDEGARDRRIR